MHKSTSGRLSPTIDKCLHSSFAQALEDVEGVSAVPATLWHRLWQCRVAGGVKKDFHQPGVILSSCFATLRPCVHFGVKGPLTRTAAESRATPKAELSQLAARCQGPGMSTT